VDDKQRERFLHMKEIWQRFHPGESFEGSETETQILQLLAEARMDAIVQAGEGKKIWTGTMREAALYARDHKRLEESDLAAMKAFAKEWKRPDGKTFDPVNLRKYLYVIDISRKP